MPFTVGNRPSYDRRDRSGRRLGGDDRRATDRRALQRRMQNMWVMMDRREGSERRRGLDRRSGAERRLVLDRRRVNLN